MFNFFRHNAAAPAPNAPAASSTPPAENSGAALVGVECYLWDDSFVSAMDATRIGIVTSFASSKPFPYRKDKRLYYQNAHPVALGMPPEGYRPGAAVGAPSVFSFPFSVGDMVRVKRSVTIPRYGFGPVTHDSIGRVTRVDGDMCVAFPEHPSWNAEPSEMELVIVADSSLSPAQAPALTWDDVKGQDEAKQALREVIEIPRRHAALYAAYGKRAPKGALLYGPPGCGKTMLGRTFAASLGGGKDGKDGFRYIKGGELFEPSVGEEETKIREIFAAAKQHKARTGVPQIVFFDEADALFPKRTGKADRGHSYDFMASAMAAFLTELDGMEECGAFVILATNRPEVMDPAVLRDGRIDRKVKIARPNRDVVGDILRAGLAKVPGFAEELVTVALDEIYSQRRLYYVAKTEDRGDIRVLFHHGISGAMADGIVERTLNAALQRDIAASASAPSGITAEDVREAVEGSWKSTLGLDLQWLLEEVVGNVKIEQIVVGAGRWLGVGSASKLKLEVEHKINHGDCDVPGLGI